MLWGVQYLRAVAAVSVLLFHAALGAGGHDALGTGGVDIFFVISGFLMFGIASTSPPVGKFVRDRLTRIVPAYWIVTGIVVTLQLIGLTEHSRFDFEHVVKSLLFFPSLDDARGKIYPLLIVGWTLNYEMFFYLIVAGLLFVPARARLACLVAVLAACIGFGMIWGEGSVPAAFYGNPIILEFAFGALLSELWRRGTFDLGGWLAIVIGGLLMISPQPSVLPRFIGYGIPAAMIVGGVLSLERQQRIRRYFWPALLGNASYSIYLWHMFFVAATYRLFGETPPAFALAMLGGVALGLVSYFIIEKPLARLAAWRLKAKAAQL